MQHPEHDRQSPFQPRRREALQAVLGGLLVASPFMARAQAASVDVANVIYGFPAGGVTGLTARLVSDRLVPNGYARTASIADSRPGAAGRIACAAVKNAAPDGTRLLLAPVGLLSIYPHIFKSLEYDSFKDFAPISTVARQSFGMAVGPAVPASVVTVRDFLDWAKKNPGQATYGSPGAGTGFHLLGAALGMTAGVELRHVPFRGSVPGVADLVGGHLSSMLAPTSDFLEYMRAGKLRMLATADAQRSTFTPNVPTFAEAGFPDLTANDHYGVFAPAGTPAPLLASANAAIQKAVGDPAMVQALAGQAMEPRASTGDELARQLRRDYEFWGALVKRVGFTPES